MSAPRQSRATFSPSPAISTCIGGGGIGDGGSWRSSRSDPAPGPGRVAEGRQEPDAALRELGCLPEATRSALLLHVEEHLTYAEIGRALGISAGAVKVRVHRARTRMAAARDGKGTRS
jgi:DNA-directed RNA polymerase specialized sigma24 family protein